MPHNNYISSILQYYCDISVISCAIWGIKLISNAVDGNLKSNFPSTSPDPEE